MNTLETIFSGRKTLIQTGKLAKQADGSVWMQCGETVVMANVCYDKIGERDVDFFPLTVEYKEKASATGKFPGGFFKRENRPSEGEILRGRIIDRSIRPLFPETFRSEVQVILNVLSYDQQMPHDVLAVNAVSLALCISPVPFNGPLSAVSVALFEGNDQFVVNPDEKSLETAKLDLFVSGTRDRVLMIESGASEVSEETMIKAIKFAHDEIIKQIAVQEEFIKNNAKEKVPVPAKKITPEFQKEVYDYFRPLCDSAIRVLDKASRGVSVKAAADQCQKYFTEKLGIKPEQDKELADLKKKLKIVFEEVEYDVVRDMIFNEKIRVDGRKLDEIRHIECEIDLLPRTHGSALFTRGQTQSLAMITLGTKKDEQIVEGLLEETRQKFMLHYNFPPYATGEVKPLRGPGRREIGHGNLAEKALSYVMPAPEAFPYTVRVISEIVESNGSSSMASICAGCLGLMDAGVPIKAPVAGIAMGLITRGNEWTILTDIAGIEDHCGDMDFKVGGTSTGITAIQLDVKIHGLTHEMIAKTIHQAREARMHILGKMQAAISAPRPELSKYAPRITVIMINPEKVREVIGPGGKMIKSIVEATGAQIDIEDSGKISICSVDFEKSQKAIKMITDLTKEIQAGEVYTGKVVRLMNFGAFVEILPGRDGLVHISELAWQRTEKVEDVCKIGDEMTVKVMEIDSMNRINLSRRATMEKPEGFVERPPAPPRAPQGGGFNRGGGGGRR